MKKLNCLIVDDEPPAHRVLEKYIAKINSLELTGNCYTAFDAIDFLYHNSVDILFLDIEMPELSGLDMLKTLSNPPAVILTTAYSQFALEGYELGVVDYLLKPIRFERFLKSISRITERKDFVAGNSFDYFFVKADGIQHKINFDDIRFIEAFGNFVKVHLNQHTLLSAETMTEIQHRLPETIFLRVHKSFIINIKRVVMIEGNQIFVGNEIIPIGTSFRVETLKFFGIK